MSDSEAMLMDNLMPASWKEPQWYAIYTRVNQERLVAERLDRRGVQFYLPIYKTVRRRSDRRVTLSLPLFPGYLFAHIPLTDRLRVLEVPNVVRLVGGPKYPAALPNEEIDLLRKGLSGQVLAEPCSYLTTGCRVRVVNGPFEGVEGILAGQSRGSRVVISVEVIMRSFTIEVNEYDLERI